MKSWGGNYEGWDKVSLIICCWISAQWESEKMSDKAGQINFIILLNSFELYLTQNLRNFLKRTDTTYGSFIRI